MIVGFACRAKRALHIPGPISKIVPCSRTSRYGRMQAIILWIGFVWRRGVLGYAFVFALLRCLRCRLSTRAGCGFVVAFRLWIVTIQYTDWLDRLGGFSIATNTCSTLIYGCLGVMCVLLNVGCSRRTLKPTSLPRTRPCRGPRLIQRGCTLVERLRHAQHGNASGEEGLLMCLQSLLSSASACPSQQ